MSLLLTQTEIIWPMMLCALIGGYLSGSVPYGLILTRLAGRGDIRQQGSGNIGATNVLRTGSKKLAACTLLLDALKGAVPVLVARQYHMDYAVVAGLAAFIGHLFPVWLGFKGGKGVATALGILYAFSPFLGLIVTLSWLAVALIFHYSSLAALVAFGLSPFFTLWITSDYQLTVTVFILAIVILARHHENIRRLAKGEESKISLLKKS